MRHPLDTLLDPVRSTLASAARLSVIASLLWIAQAFCLAVALSDVAGRVSARGDASGAIDAGTALPWLPALGFLLLALLRAALDYRAGGRVFQAADTVLATTRQDLLERESRRSPRDAEAPVSASFAALMAEKVELLKPYLLRYQLAESRVRLVPLAIVLAVLPFSWAAAAVLLVSGPLIPLFMALIGQAAGKASVAQLQEIGSMNALLLERLSALVDIRVLDAAERSLVLFHSAAEKLQQRTLGVLRIAFLSSTVLELFAAIGVAMVAVHVGFSLLGLVDFGTWGSPLTLAEGIFILLLAPDFYQPLRDLGAAWHDRASARAVAEELAEEAQRPALSVLAPMTEPPGGLSVPDSASVESGARVDPRSRAADRTPPSLATESLSFALDNGGRIAYPDLELPAGSSLAIVGASGCGKSTLLYLLSGLAPATEGRILIDDVPLTADNAGAWRERIGWLPQIPYFVDGSLRRNLLLGAAPGTAPSRIREALDAAAASTIVDRLPGGLGAIPGESGSGVSGGEARRLVLARALLASPDILLADEPTADLDTETASLVRHSLLALKERGVTLLVATHDHALAAAMDRQLELDGDA